MDIGKRIRFARKSAGLSQEALARRAEMSLRALNSLERGESADPHYSTLVGIADALGVSIGELLGETVLAGKAEAPEAGPPDTSGTRVGVARAKTEHVRLEGLVRAYKTVARMGRDVARSFIDFKEADLQRLSDFHALAADLALLRGRDILGRDPDDLADTLEELEEAQDAVQLALQEHMELAKPEKRPLLLRAAELVGERQT